MTNKQTTPSPLWRELNEKRTQGNWEVASSEPGDEYSLNVLAPINITGDKRTVVMANPNLYFMDRAEQNAQYTALAVNNFASLAEVLGNFIEVSEQRKEYHSVFEAATLKRAKDLMAAIS